MTLDEIKDMSDARIGCDLTVRLGLNKSITESERFCSSLDAIAEIEKIVIRQTDKGFYALRLALVVLSFVNWSPEIMRQRLSFYEICLISTATARQRAEACLLALTEGE